MNGLGKVAVWAILETARLAKRLDWQKELTKISSKRNASLGMHL